MDVGNSISDSNQRAKEPTPPKLQLRPRTFATGPVIDDLPIAQPLFRLPEALEDWGDVRRDVPAPHNTFRSYPLTGQLSDVNTPELEVDEVFAAAHGGSGTSPSPLGNSSAGVRSAAAPATTSNGLLSYQELLHRALSLSTPATPANSSNGTAVTGRNPYKTPGSSGNGAASAAPAPQANKSPDGSSNGAQAVAGGHLGGGSSSGANNQAWGSIGSESSAVQQRIQSLLSQQPQYSLGAGGAPPLQRSTSASFLEVVVDQPGGTSTGGTGNNVYRSISAMPGGSGGNSGMVLELQEDGPSGPGQYSMRSTKPWRCSVSAARESAALARHILRYSHNTPLKGQSTESPASASPSNRGSTSGSSGGAGRGERARPASAPRLSRQYQDSGTSVHERLYQQHVQSTHASLQQPSQHVSPKLRNSDILRMSQRLYDEATMRKERLVTMTQASRSPSPRRSSSPRNPRETQAFFMRQSALLDKRAWLTTQQRPTDEEDLSECTWQPNILPASRQMHRSVRDMHAWEARKNIKVARAQVDKEQRATDGCTFAPAINQRSRQMAKVAYAASPDPKRPWTTQSSGGAWPPSGRASTQGSGSFGGGQAFTATWSAARSEPQQQHRAHSASCSEGGKGRDGSSSPAVLDGLLQQLKGMGKAPPAAAGDEEWRQRCLDIAAEALEAALGTDEQPSTAAASPAPARKTAGGIHRAAAEPAVPVRPTLNLQLRAVSPAGDYPAAASPHNHASPRGRSASPMQRQQGVTRSMSDAWRKAANNKFDYGYANSPTAAKAAAMANFYSNNHKLASKDSLPASMRQLLLEQQPAGGGLAPTLSAAVAAALTSQGSGADAMAGFARPGMHAADLAAAAASATPISTYYIHTDKAAFAAEYPYGSDKPTGKQAPKSRLAQQQQQQQQRQQSIAPPQVAAPVHSPEVQALLQAAAAAASVIAGQTAGQTTMPAAQAATQVLLQALSAIQTIQQQQQQQPAAQAPQIPAPPQSAAGLRAESSGVPATTENTENKWYSVAPATTEDRRYSVAQLLNAKARGSLGGAPAAAAAAAPPSAAAAVARFSPALAAVRAAEGQLGKSLSLPSMPVAAAGTEASAPLPKAISMAAADLTAATRINSKIRNTSLGGVRFTSLRAAAAAKKQQAQQQQPLDGLQHAAQQSMINPSDSTMSVGNDSCLEIQILGGDEAAGAEPAAAAAGDKGLESMSKPYELADSPAGSRLGPGLPPPAGI